MVYLTTGLTWLIATVFLLAVWGKVFRRGGFGNFVRSLHGLPGVPPRYARPAAVLLVAAESSVVLVLLLPGRTAAVAGLGLATGLLSVFAVGIALALRGGARVPCNCFGASRTPLGPRHLIRNVFLAAIAAIAASVTGTAGGPPAEPAGTVVAAAAGLAAGALVAALDDLLALLLPTSAARR